MRWDEEKELFKTLLINTANDLKILEEYVEKDYWLILILKTIFSKSQDYVFKGGTSLSKCYHLINRFSEDIDVSYSTEYDSLTVNDINRRFKGITRSVKEVGLEIENKDHLRRNAYFNQFRCPYPSLFDGNTIEKKVVIELAGHTPSFPSKQVFIQSFIGEYLEKINRHDLVEKYELEPFLITAQTLERTLVDKTYAMCDYYLDNKAKNHSRHIYDVYKILGVVELNEKLSSLYSEVREHRKKIVVCKSAKDGVNISDILSKIIEDDFFKKDYEGTTFNLLYEQIPYLNCKDSLIKLRNFLSNYNL